MTELEIKDMQLDITKIDGKTKIIYKKPTLIGGSSQKDLMDMLVLAASLQAEHYIKKLSRNAPLDKDEVKALTELANLAKTNIVVVKEDLYEQVDSKTNTQAIKENLYKALKEKLEKPK